jgi:hypothetical protein
MTAEGFPLGMTAEGFPLGMTAAGFPSARLGLKSL